MIVSFFRKYTSKVIKLLLGAQSIHLNLIISFSSIFVDILTKCNTFATISGPRCQVNLLHHEKAAPSFRYSEKLFTFDTRQSMKRRIAAYSIDFSHCS